MADYLFSIFVWYLLPALSIGLVYLAVKIEKPLTPYLLLLGIVVITLVALMMNGWFDSLTLFLLGGAWLAVVVSIVILFKRKRRARF